MIVSVEHVDEGVLAVPGEPGLVGVFQMQEPMRMRAGRVTRLDQGDKLAKGDDAGARNTTSSNKRVMRYNVLLPAASISTR